jgi:beta-glucanase (GH16 family)
MIHDKLRTIFYLLFLFGCSGEANNDSLVLPYDLIVTINQSNDGTGSVSLEATAQLANFYSFYFGDKENESPVRSMDGKASHQYATSGSYTIRVLAHATDAKFIEQSYPINIILGNNDQPNIPTTGYTSPTSYPGLTLVWEDNFSGSTLNSAYWTAEIGTGTNGWGNNELQYYRQENTSVQNGHLVITAKKESFSGSNYTSSRLITKQKKSFQYGRVDIRAVLPKGQGIWPAFWMLGDNFPTVGWPRCGEIDIMEMIGGAGNRDNTVYGTLHWDNAGNYACTCGTGGYTLPNGIFADEFHVFSLVWNENTITWLVDNVQFHQISISPAELSEFRAPFFFIFNLAVGGNWPGSPDPSTVFPQHLIVDYIRVFQ